MKQFKKLLYETLNKIILLIKYEREQEPHKKRAKEQDIPHHGLYVQSFRKTIRERISPLLLGVTS